MTPREVLARRRCCGKPDGSCMAENACMVHHGMLTGASAYNQADADIAALRAAGYRIAPVEPTAAMILAGCYAVDAVPEIYRAMLTAAEKEPANG